MKKFTFKDWHGRECQMTAEEFYKRILEDSKRSDYSWLTSAHEIYDVCTQEEFPPELAIEIKMAVLKCFSNILDKHDVIGYWKDEVAVYSMYNELYDCERYDVILAKQGFLAAIIESAVYTAFELPRHSGNVYRRFRQQFKGKTYKKYVNQKDVDLKELTKQVREEFVKSLVTAEAQGIFKAEDEENMHQMVERLKDSLP